MSASSKGDGINGTASEGRRSGRRAGNLRGSNDFTPLKDA